MTFPVTFQNALIPDALFKIVVKEQAGSETPDVLAFLFPQVGVSYTSTQPNELIPYLTSVAVLEALTGLDFLTPLPDDQEARAERVTPISVWD